MPITVVALALSGAVGLICRQILTDFNKKGRKGAEVSLILGSPRNIIFPTHTNKNSVFLKPKIFQKVKITREANFFP
jgi:hypothetical protein